MPKIGLTKDALAGPFDRANHPNYCWFTKVPLENRMTADYPVTSRNRLRSDEEEDYAVPVWCAVQPLRTVLGEPEECPRQLPGVTPEAGGMASYVPGRRFDEVMLESYGRAYPTSIEPL